ncbi:MAG: DUF4446 family protein [Anaerolineae bacterium]|nr:DUF4446 family protein [Anaerolineae bacterium]
MSLAAMTYIVIGLGTALVGVVAWLVVLQVRVNRLTRNYRRLMAGTDGESLEQALTQHVDQVRGALETVQALQAESRRMGRTLQHALQWMGMVRYNPFRDTGGDQSFAWALVDGRGNGVVLSSLHSRTSTRMYAKPLHEWESSYSLTDEEQEAIARASQQQAME